jgi:hypothetical protein
MGKKIKKKKTKPLRIRTFLDITVVFGLLVFGYNYYISHTLGHPQLSSQRSSRNAKALRAQVAPPRVTEETVSFGDIPSKSDAPTSPQVLW